MTSGTYSQSESIRLEDGRDFVLRPLRTDDLDALRRAFHRLTPEEVRLRFLQYTGELPASVVSLVSRLDPDRLAAFVVDDGSEIRAVADLHVDPSDTRKAEFGLIVGKAVSGHGLGTRLMQRLLAEARRRGIEVVRGDVRADNARMLELCRELGAHIEPMAGDPTLYNVWFTLRTGPARW